jgi:DNA recombination protein RmuC
MDWILPLALGLVGLVVAGWVIGRLLAGRSQALGAKLDQMEETLRTSRAELEVRLKLLNDNHGASQLGLADRLHAQERELAKALEERLTQISERVGKGLESSTERTLETMTKLEVRLAVIDRAQDDILKLSSEVIGLKDILANKQARGAFGEIQLENLVRQVLPAAHYRFQATLSNGKRVDCLLDLPRPPGPIAIDAKFPLESYHALRTAGGEPERLVAVRAFRADLLKHIGDIASKYLIPGETADAALMFLPSEAVYAELYANFVDVVEESYRQRVFVVSPTTLFATLNTVRAILKDVRMREQAHLIQREVGLLIVDIGRLDERVGKLKSHFDQASEDVRQIGISSGKVGARVERIETMPLDEGAGAEPALDPPTPPETP